MKETTDKDFYVRSCTVDWDCIRLDLGEVDLRKAAELVSLAMKTGAGIPTSIPCLLKHDPSANERCYWEVVGNHTHAYAAIKLCKVWQTAEASTWGKHHPCEASGMVRVNTLNACSVGTNLGREQPSQAYLDAVLAML